MNLYKILMQQHYAPKDSQIGIVTYLVGQSDEVVYEWLKSEPKLPDDIWIYTPYNDNERDGITFEIYDADYNVIGEESYKDRMIRLKGEMFDEEVELSDLYYGKTLYGWKLIKEDVKPDVLQMIKEYGICIEIVYTYLGNDIRRNLCEQFVHSGFDLSILNKGKRN